MPCKSQTILLIITLSCFISFLLSPFIIISIFLSIINSTSSDRASHIFKHQRDSEHCRALSSADSSYVLDHALKDLKVLSLSLSSWLISRPFRNIFLYEVCIQKLAFSTENLSIHQSLLFGFRIDEKTLRSFHGPSGKAFAKERGGQWLPWLLLGLWKSPTLDNSIMQIYSLKRQKL